MTKDGLVEAVQASLKLDTKAHAHQVVEAVFGVIQATLAKGEKVTVTGFGSFRVVKTAERQGRNPKTGESITIPAGSKSKFRAGKGLKDAVK